MLSGEGTVPVMESNTPNIRAVTGAFALPHWRYWEKEKYFNLTTVLRILRKASIFLSTTIFGEPIFPPGMKKTEEAVSKSPKERSDPLAPALKDRNRKGIVSMIWGNYERSL
jgi:hypothetical protein